MKSVEIRWGWLLITLSVVALVFLRHHKWVVVTYAGLVVLGVVAFILLGPRLAAQAEARFRAQALAMLHAGQFVELTRLAQRQWWLNRFGRRHVIADIQGLSALAQDDAASARKHFAAALEAAPAPDKPRLSLSLARAERAAGLEAEAEGRLRELLTHHHGVTGVQAELGRLLLARGQAAEAAALLRAALARGGQPAGGALRLDLARALLVSGQPGVAEVLSAAAAEGADPDAVAALRARHQATTAG
ncbi:MAG: hypothetical protein H6702_15965 [Myxococcales bacterium]|nr:hypothetical protein [Myxococcales bacterium]